MKFKNHNSSDIYNSIVLIARWIFILYFLISALSLWYTINHDIEIDWFWFCLFLLGFIPFAWWIYSIIRFLRENYTIANAYKNRPLITAVVTKIEKKRFNYYIIHAKNGKDNFICKRFYYEYNIDYILDKWDKINVYVNNGDYIVDINNLSKRPFNKKYEEKFWKEGLKNS